MPWEVEGEGIRFSGYLTDLMTIIMTAYDQDAESGRIDLSPGVYVTATAIVLREVLLESLVPDDSNAEFLEFVSQAMQEDDEGRIEIATFALLDRIAEEIDADALEGWIASEQVRDAIVDLAMTAFPVE